MARLDQHLREPGGEWLAFRHDPEVPPTTNHAEQMLRPAVITRKVGGGNPNLQGALVPSIWSSILMTCHRRGQRFLELARTLWQSNQPQAIPVETLPEPTSEPRLISRDLALRGSREIPLNKPALYSLLTKGSTQPRALPRSKITSP